MKLNDNFLAQMQAATQLLHTSGPAAATEAIQRALGTAGAPAHDAGSARSVRTVEQVADPVRKTGPQQSRFTENLRSGVRSLNRLVRGLVEDVEPSRHASPQQEPSAPGKFLSGSFSNAAGTRAYRLYVPSSYCGEPLPLVVLLHGCKQDPVDFAAGTGMNLLAEQQGCLVLYPAQAAKANGSNCWNWFNPADQQRDRGEPSIVADMTREVMREYRVDQDRVYLAGLSAGGAMASILAARYPDLYAAVAVHSGLPVGAARDVASAFQAMKQPGAAPLPPYREPVPVIVFHGDRDGTVHPDHGLRVIAQCMGVPAGDAAAVQSSSAKGTAAQGRSYTRRVFSARDGRSAAEHWVIHGAGHAWSGGRAGGSYTDPSGPDATAEMLRFFFEHPRAR